MVTVKDIARKLDVAPSTVTRALAGSPRISARTRKLVRRTADEMGYVADTAARTMRSRESTLIGLLVPDIENIFYARIARGFSDVCNANGFQLTLAVSDDDAAIEERHIRELVAARCAGIAVVPTAGLTARSAALLAPRNVVQLIRRNDAVKADWYGIDDVDALRQATGYLADLGHDRIALICGDEALSSGEARYRGYVDALREKGLAPDPALVMRGPPRAGFAAAAACRLREIDDPPTAMIAAGAALTEGMLSAVAGWSAAERQALSLVGYSECSAFGWWDGAGLTVIDLPVRQIAADLCGTLLERARAKETPPVSPPASRIYQSHMIMRGSARPRR